jgi:hypothetical protein
MYEVHVLKDGYNVKEGPGISFITRIFKSKATRLSSWAIHIELYVVLSFCDGTVSVLVVPPCPQFL